MTQRMCSRGRCKTKLSRYNPGPYCWAHTALTIEKRHVGNGHGRSVTVDQLVLLEGGDQMSNRFVEGIPEILTDEDRAIIASGEWIGISL